MTEFDLAEEFNVGDARRCPVHQGEKTSSDDGMFDVPCRLCEGEMDEAAERWEHDRDNPRRRYCGTPRNTFFQWPNFWPASCVPDAIPF